MGYELCITRKENWFDEDGPLISLDEWLAYVEGDPEMRFDGFAEAKLPDGSILRIEGEGLSVWTAYSGHEVDGNMAWFDYRGDSILVKNPDEEIIGKMVRIGRALGAKVQGDEGEVYAEDGSSNWEELRNQAPPKRPQSEHVGEPSQKKPWWKFW